MSAENCTAYTLTCSMRKTKSGRWKIQVKTFSDGWVSLAALVMRTSRPTIKWKFIHFSLFSQMPKLANGHKRKWHSRRLIRTFFGYLRLYLSFLVAHWEASAPKINSTCLFQRRRKKIMNVEPNVFDIARWCCCIMATALLHRCRDQHLFACMSQLSHGNSVRAWYAMRCAVRRRNRSTQNTWINHLCSCEKEKPFYICIYSVLNSELPDVLNIQRIQWHAFQGDPVV